MFARLAALAAAVFTLISTPAFAIAQPPSITGNSWIAIGILGALIGLIILTVVASVGLQRRDERSGRADDSGFSLFGRDDDDSKSRPPPVVNFSSAAVG